MSTPPPNGSLVTWRELTLALDPVRDDLAELKRDVKAMRASTEERTFLGPRGRAAVNGLLLALGTTLISAGVATAVAVLAS